jgi:hypothetical protein
MKNNCNLANLFAAVRAAAWPTVKAIFIIAGGFLALGACLTAADLLVHPEMLSSMLQRTSSRNVLIAECVGLVLLVSYGLCRNRTETLLKIVGCVIGLGLALGFARYAQWVFKTVPAFGMENMPAIFEVSGLSFGARMGILPVQIGVGLLGVMGVCMVLGVIWYGLYETCKYGANVRQQNAANNPQA